MPKFVASWETDGGIKFENFQASSLDEALEYCYNNFPQMTYDSFSLSEYCPTSRFNSLQTFKRERGLRPIDPRWR